jgi:mannose-6-phosphate isomerase-like protein (cupin superfamily)
MGAMSKVQESLLKISQNPDKSKLAAQIASCLEVAGYKITEVDDARPWGMFFRIDESQADRFAAEFFPGLDPEDARLGNSELSLTPKILVHMPGKRNSWQYHHRRAEIWRFLTDGAYQKSTTDDPGDEIIAKAGSVVRFAVGKRHRLIGAKDKITFVAEIWQHTDADNLSDETDIVRIEDDFNRK